VPNSPGATGSHHAVGGRNGTLQSENRKRAIAIRDDACARVRQARFNY
jgi:hypothetical protein